MNKKYKIYLAGGMSNIPFSEADSWRNNISNRFTSYDSSIQLINPNFYYNTLNPASYDSEREVREFDLYKVRNSDLIIVNFNDPNSIGTAQELAIAAEYRIPVIGLNERNLNLHPWLTECCNKIFKDMGRLVEYVYEYYLT